MDEKVLFGTLLLVLSCGKLARSGLPHIRVTSKTETQASHHCRPVLPLSRSGRSHLDLQTRRGRLI
jgi:hypothetical protein